MQVTGIRKFLYSAIVCAVALLALEVILSTVYFHANRPGFATYEAIKGGWRIVLGRGDRELDHWLDMPESVFDDLASINGVIDNTNNPTGVTRDNSPITEHSEEFGFKMRSGARIANHLIRPKDSPNLSPPVVQYPSGEELPEGLKAWLDENTALSHEFTTDSQGRRRTLPEVSAENKVVIAGDSVAFGLGVSDENTVASALQRRAGRAVQVVNLGVPSYGAEQAYTAAVTSEFANQGHVLIYIACQNDFHAKNSEGVKLFDVEAMESWIEKFQKLEDDGVYDEVVIVMETYLQYSFHTFFDEWKAERIASIRDGLAAFDALTEERGIAAINWDSLVGAYNVENETLFGGVALYVDHVHLSPLGNRVLAEAIYEQLR